MLRVRYSCARVLTSSISASALAAIFRAVTGGFSSGLSSKLKPVGVEYLTSYHHVLHERDTMMCCSPNQLKQCQPVYVEIVGDHIHS